MKRTWKSRVLFAGFASVLVAGVAGVAVLRWRHVRSAAELADVELDFEIESQLGAADSARVRDLVKSMMNPDNSTDAVAELRRHIETLIRQESPAAPLSMVYYIECLANRFNYLDRSTRQLNLTFLSEIFGWFGENSASCWPALLQPSKSILQSAASEGETRKSGKGGICGSQDVAIQALQMIRAIWEWSPPDVSSPAERKSLGTWKAELHARCVEIFSSCDHAVRAAAGVAVVSVPIESEAARGLVLLRDESPAVRRALLFALEPRPVLLSSEDVATFLRDPAAIVRSAADLILTNRGLSREQIALVSRATDPSPLVRAQASRHIVGTTAVDRAVWLTHLSRDEEPSVRSEAVRALAEVGDDDCRTRLAEMARSDPEPQIRQLAQQLSGGPARLQPPRAEPTDSDAETLPPIRAPKVN